MKPVYRIPTMDEVRSMPWNGLSVASFFAGGGGSSTGYRMGGAKVVFANEFVDSAAETYRANAGAHTVVDQSDIRTLEPGDVLDAIGMKAGELDVLDGSPPCASFSTAGARDRLWGKEKSYSTGTVQRTDDLFDHYVRMVDGIAPKVFVAENVSGMVKGSSIGHFLNALDDFERCGPGYRVEARMLDSKWLGVPQTRQRIFFVGVRRDIDARPVFPKPLPYYYTIRDALPDVESPTGQVEREAWMNSQWTKPGEPYAVGREWEKLSPGEQSDKFFQLVRCNPDLPVGTLTATAGNPSAASVSHPFECRKFSIAEVKRLSGFPDDYALTGTFAQKFERCGRSVTPPVTKAICETIRREILR